MSPAKSAGRGWDARSPAMSGAKGLCPRGAGIGRCGYNRWTRNHSPRSKDRTVMPLDREAVVAALRSVKDPELFKDIVTLGMVKDVKVEGGHVYVNVELTTPACPMKETIQRDVEAAVRRAGATSV